MSLCSLLLSVIPPTCSCCYYVYSLALYTTVCLSNDVYTLYVYTGNPFFIKEMCSTLLEKGSISMGCVRDPGHGARSNSATAGNGTNNSRRSSLASNCSNFSTSVGGYSSLALNCSNGERSPETDRGTERGAVKRNSIRYAFCYCTRQYIIVITQLLSYGAL
jgi:hypothetical protein